MTKLLRAHGGRSRTPTLAVLAVLALAGCSSSTNGAVAPPVVTGTITVNLTPSSVTVSPGGSGSAGLTVTRGGNFAGAVSLGATGLPAGITVAFASPTVSASAVSTSVTVTVAAGMPTSTTNISITGNGSGITSQPAVFTVRVP